MSRMNLVLFLGVVSAGLAASADDVVNGKPQQSPEEVAKAFLVAVSSKDEQAVKQVILPNRNAAVLWRGEAPPREALPKITSWRECKAGESVMLPGRQKLMVTHEMVNETRKVFLPVVGGQLTPPLIPLVLVDGEWKVDAASLITQITDGRRIKHVAQLARACLAYAEDNQGVLPSALSELQNISSDIAIGDYEIVVRGKRSAYERPGSTVLVREKRKDADAKYAAAYVDGHADFRRAADDEAKRVRALCNVCGAGPRAKPFRTPGPPVFGATSEQLRS